MTMMNPNPRRPALPDLLAFLARAQTALRTARDELRDAAGRHAGHDPAAALALAQLATGVDAVAARVPPRWSQPVTPDTWLVEADMLHTALSTALRGLWPLQNAAEDRWTIPPVPEAAFVRPGDGDLFGREPRDGDDRWTDPRDVSDLKRLPLAAGTPAWERRAAAVAAAEGWAREYQAAVDAAGVGPIRDGMVGLAAVLGEICAGAGEVRATTVLGVRAKGRIAARALVEDDADPFDLAALARDHAAERGPMALDALAWSAVADLLAVEPGR